MNNIELIKEKVLTPPLIEFLEDRGIETVAFDIDNTVLNTELLFHQTLYAFGLDIALSLPFEVSPPCYEEITRQLEEKIYEIYYRNKRKPKLIGEQAREALSSFLEELQIKEITPAMHELVNWYEQRHYTISPKPYTGVPELLRVIRDSQRNIVFNSHAQQEWTELKIAELSNLFPDSPTFQFIAVPLEEEKDSDSWKTIYGLAETDAENVLTVGDNFNADILSAIEAGCKNVVWINSRNSNLPENFTLDKDVHLFIIKNIGDLQYINTSHRLVQ